MSNDRTQAEYLKEKNTGDPAKEFDHEQSADDSILNSDGELVSGQRSQQLGHSSRKCSHSQSDIVICVKENNLSRKWIANLEWTTETPATNAHTTLPLMRFNSKPTIT